jgi:DNA-binding transcriptional MerR regulator
VSTTSGTGTAESAPPLLGIGAAAARAGVTERALRYYQELGLLNPCHCTPGGMRRYSEEDLDRVARIRQLQTLLGLDLDEVAEVLRGEDRLAEIRLACVAGDTSDVERLGMARESLRLLTDLRATVVAKREAVEGFLADLDARITRSADWLASMTTRTENLPPLHRLAAKGLTCAKRARVYGSVISK